MASKATYAASVVLQTAAKDRVNRGGPGAPSVAPKGPFNQTGTLLRSIQIDERKNNGPKPFCRVGPSNGIAPYAVRLEFGFVGRDKKGRQINQAARPYMRDSFAKSQKNMRKAALVAANNVFKEFAMGGGR